MDDTRIGCYGGAILRRREARCPARCGTQTKMPRRRATVPRRGLPGLEVRMKTLTKTRKQSKPKVQRAVRIGPNLDGVRLLVITDSKGVRTGYELKELAVDFGRGFEVTKFEMEQAPEDDKTYHVHLDVQLGDSCSCRGGCYTGHCKHIDALNTLVSLGKV